MKRALLGLGIAIVMGVGFGIVAAEGGHGAEAQAADAVWYRIVNEGRSAGTMAEWRRVGEGAAATIPFMEGFEVNVRPVSGVVHATVHDGQARVSTAISCDSERSPRRAMLRATRAGADQPTVVVALQCSATQPPAR
ncbi:MAG: hypothetical protein EVA89_16625 [Sandaracinaceae bacterium]|nr:MAG: hypothetical protein EVA89_16625 [Sandaracinaceae bacterium]